MGTVSNVIHTIFDAIEVAKKTTETAGYKNISHSFGLLKAALEALDPTLDDNGITVTGLR